MLGKQDNCQVAVSVSLASQAASLPVAWQLYLPREWADDPPRRDKAGVPQAMQFTTKPAMALQQIEHLMDQGAPKHCVLADAGYGVDTAFRDRLTELGLRYAVGITGSVTVWPPGREPLPPRAAVPRGHVGTRLRRGGSHSPQHNPLSVKTLALSLEPEQWQTVTWREGTNADLHSRFARIRVRAAHRDNLRDELRPPEWLLIEWPEGDAEPLKYWLSTLPEEVTLQRMAFETKMRWRIERDYQDLKQDLGLGHYEGRGWRGFHHHASLSIAAYGFLLAQRLQHPNEIGGKKNSAQLQEPALPTHYRPRGSPPSAAPRPILHHQLADPHRRASGPNSASLPVLLLVLVVHRGVAGGGLGRSHGLPRPQPARGQARRQRDHEHQVGRADHGVEGVEDQEARVIDTKRGLDRCQVGRAPGVDADGEPRQLVHGRQALGAEDEVQRDRHDGDRQHGQCH